nr:methyltransferase domain-containing protein [Lewinella sp. JB7]
MLECTPPHLPVIEVACGIGHFLRALEATGRRTVGVDIVWSKLWLARHFLDVRGLLVCGDIEEGPVLRTAEPHTVFCHDAFYFFARKPTVLTHLRQLRQGGSLAVGHIHTRSSAHGAGFAESRADYANLTQASVRDDVYYVRGWYGQELGAPSGSPTAVGWIEGETDHQPIDWSDPSGGVELQPNPLLGQGEIRWPSTAWAREYAEDSRALNGLSVNDLLHRPPPATRADRYRQRYLINLPDRW